MKKYVITCDRKDCGYSQQVPSTEESLPEGWVRIENISFGNEKLDSMDLCPSCGAWLLCRKNVRTSSTWDG